MTRTAFLQHLVFAAGLAGLSAALVRLMIGAGVMDAPNRRKSHTVPTPKGGGVGIVAAFLAGARPVAVVQPPIPKTVEVAVEVPVPDGLNAASGMHGAARRAATLRLVAAPDEAGPARP